MPEKNGVDVQLSRRRVLQATGAGAVAATAGCMGLFEDEEGVPDYASYVAVSENDAGNDEVFIAYMDFEALNELDDEGEDSGEDDDFPEDPMLGYPITGAVALLLFAGFTIGTTGLAPLVDDKDDSLDSQVSELLLASPAIAMIGDMETDEIGEVLTAESENAFSTTYEEVDEFEGYTIYGSGDESGDATRFAVGGDEIFVGEQADIEKAIEIAAGDRERAHETFDEVEWLLSEAGRGMMVTGGYSPDGGLEEAEETSGDGPEYPAIESAQGGMGSLEFDEDDREVSAEFALSFDDLGSSTQEELENSLGADADDSSVDVDDDRVTAEATYSEDALEDN